VRIKDKTPREKRPFYQNFLIGGFSASITKTLVAPIERIKLIRQIIYIAQHKIPKNNQQVLLSYKDISTSFQTILHNEGPLSFWRGNTANVLKYLVAQALNFGFKEQFGAALTANIDPATQFYSFMSLNYVSGGLAGGASLCFVYP
jgi:solute carrier family 25 (adenine nucleotide translocator) protein 4/5/6/31